MKTEPPPHQDNIPKGMAFAFMAFLIFALMTAFSKLLATHHDVIEIAFYRNFIALGPFLIYFKLANKLGQLRIQKAGVMFIRAVLGTISLVTLFAAFANLTMAQATVLIFGSSLIMPVMAYFILKEYVGPYRWSAIILGMIGILIMAHPAGATNPLGVFFALAAAFLQAATGIALRYLKTEPAAAVTFYFILSGVILCGVCMPFIYKPWLPGDVWLFLGIGLTGAFGQLFLSNAHKYAPPAITAAFNYMGLIWAAGLDLIIWKTLPTMPIIVGGLIVIASNLFIIYREQKNVRSQKITAQATLQSLEK